MKEKSAFKNIIQSKCPQCREGDIFIKKNPYSVGFTKIHENCPKCGLKYEMEQGFWYGAMYISYALGVGVSIPIMLTLSFQTDLSIYERAAIIMGVLIVIMPLMFRYARVLWLHIFVRYQQKK